MNQTPNYQLNQWDKSDRIMMEDFNADNAKIEAALSETMALAQKAPFAVGKLESYDGSKAITVDLGRQPQMVIIGNKNGFTNIIENIFKVTHCCHYNRKIRNSKILFYGKAINGINISCRNRQSLAEKA